MLDLFPGLVLPALLTLLGVALAATLLVRPGLARSRGGAVLGTMALLGVPSFLLWVGMDQHVIYSKETAFCLSCHEMHPYGQSVTRFDEGMLAAIHFHNRYVAREHACYSCHTSYTMYGGLEAKWSGLQHLWVAYVSGAEDPIALYGEYENRDCLRCHQGRPNFVSQAAHEGQLQMMADEEISCLLCHGPMHGVEEGEVTAAKEGTREFELPDLPGVGASH